MNCAWEAFLTLVPPEMRSEINAAGKEKLLELRLRTERKPELVMRTGSCFIDRIVRESDIQFCINVASQYSPWAASTVSSGYITALGGHRIGICGSAVIKNGLLCEFRDVTSVCIRVARDFPGLSECIPVSNVSTLIIGPPGSGKTTLLRDLVRRYSDKGTGSVAVVDERCELFPSRSGRFGFPVGARTDVICRCSKAEGTEMVLRTMGPSCIAVDEITSERDCKALIHTSWCGVTLLATAHAGSRNDLFLRDVYRPLIESHIFERLIILNRDKSFNWERMYGDD